MSFSLHYRTHKLQFKFDARTSRGAISEHSVYYLFLAHKMNPDIVGVGECAPLAGLSIDHRPDIEGKLKAVCKMISEKKVDLVDTHGNINFAALELKQWPALRFALETAWLDLQNGGKKKLFDNVFSRHEAGIPINGLIWMGDRYFMQEQISKKLQEGYDCQKLKIGSLDFETELELLERIREVAAATELTIRVDANGAFRIEEAFKKLERLAKYDIHSIEQPIRQGQSAEMAQLCKYTPVPIALDEELIGIRDLDSKSALLEEIKPQYIILKPTLVGGIQESRDWISLAEQQHIGWWMTSALESNIGLNAISQFTANYDINIPHGLGTGQLYHNNIPSPLQIKQGRLWYDAGRTWGEV